MSLSPNPSLLPEAVVFIGFRLKQQGLQSAKKMGFQLILMTKDNAKKAQGLFDEIMEGDITSSVFLDESASFLKQHYRVRAVLSNYEHYVIMRSYLGQKLALPTAPLTAASRSRNKALQREALTGLRANIEFKTVSTWEEALHAFNVLGGDVFLKSIAGVKSRLVFHVESEEELKEAFDSFQTLTHDLQEGLYHHYNDFLLEVPYPDPTKVFLVEKAEYGQQVTTSSFVGASGFWHAPSLCDIYPASHLGRKDSFLAFRILPSRYEEGTIKAVKKATEESTKAVGLKHCTLFFDFLVTKKGEVKVIELASRMGGYRPLMYQVAYDLDLNRLMIENAMGQEIKMEAGPLKNHVSFVEIFPETEGVLSSIQNLERLKKDPQVSHLKQLHQKGDWVGRAKNGAKPCLSFLLRGSDYASVYEASMDYCKKLRVVLEPA